jgi:hypothetical protein
MAVKVTITNPTHTSTVNPAGGNIQISGIIDGPATVTVTLNDNGITSSVGPFAVNAAGTWGPIPFTAPAQGDLVLVTAAGQGTVDTTGVGSHTIRVTIGPPAMVPLSRAGGARKQEADGAAGIPAAGKKARTR